MKSKVLIVSTVTIPPAFMARFEELFDLRYAPDDATQTKLLAGDWLVDATAIFCSGSLGVRQDLLDRMPKLKIVCCGGTGYDGLDVPALRRRGVIITHGAGNNAPSVADHVFALILAVVRRVAWLNDAVHKGRWEQSRAAQPIAAGKRLGIVGYGSIGAEVAKRAAAFDMPIAYHNRNRRADVPHAYCASPVELAARSDILAISTPGGPGTRNLIGQAVFDAMPRGGYLINVARGSVVDTAAMIAALKSGQLAGAGLDVLDSEPEVPPYLLDHPDVVFTPHIGGRSPEAADQAIELVIRNLDAHFAGKPVLTPIPSGEGP